MGNTEAGKPNVDERRQILILLLFWGLILALIFRPQLHGMDTVAYYAWLHSVVMRGSLDVSPVFAHYGYIQERGLSPTGYRINEWPVGPALLWSPFFVGAHLVVLLGRSLGWSVSADGYSTPYLIMTAMGSAIYGLMGLWLILRLVRIVAPPIVALWTALCVGFASPLVFYMSAHPFMAHACDFFINALFLYHWLGKALGTKSPFLLGLIGGFAATVRYQNALLLIWPLLENIVDLWRAPRENARRLLVLLAGGFLGFFPQMAVWWIVFGQWIVLNPYGLAGAGSFDWRSPHFLDVLFSTNRGLLLWAPISAFAVWGLLRYLAIFKPDWAVRTGILSLVQIYLVGSWSAWSGAAAFGPRLLTGLFPALSLGLGALYKVWLRRRGKCPVILTSIAAIGWNFILLARYGLQDVPRMGPVPLDHLWLGQFAFLIRVGEYLGRLVQALLRRGP